MVNGVLALCVLRYIWFSRVMPTSTPNQHQYRSQSNVIFSHSIVFKGEKRTFVPMVNNCLAFEEYSSEFTIHMKVYLAINSRKINQQQQKRGVERIPAILKYISTQSVYMRVWSCGARFECVSFMLQQRPSLLILTDTLEHRRKNWVIALVWPNTYKYTLTVLPVSRVYNGYD